MIETKLEENDNVEMMELDQDIKQTIRSPFEEYRERNRSRRKITFLFIVMLFVELSMVVFLFESTFNENLHYRVTRQIENNIKNENQFDTGTYTGNTDFGYFIGDGVFNFKSGTTYTGAWNNNQMNGLGMLNVPSDGTYKGEFIDSKKSGQGIFSWNDGSVYDGEWKNDQMDGQGVYTDPNKVKYDGIFKENKFWEGDCKFENATGTYVAKFKNSSIHELNAILSDGTHYIGETDGTVISGTGNMCFVNGDQYTGNYDNGLRSGQGVYVWSSGDQYDGEWDQDMMNGNGKYTYANGSYAHGDFEKNQFVNGSFKVIDSFGEYIFTIEEREPIYVDMKLNNGTQYSGDMENGKLYGKAKITYSNGDQYDGKVKDGYKSGSGKYYWCSGAYYTGGWKDDKMDGNGTYYYSDKEIGYRLAGKYKKGVPNGECKYYVSSSESYKTDWINGKCVKVYE